MIDLAKARLELAPMDRSTDDYKDLAEQIKIGEALIAFVSDVHDLLDGLGWTAYTGNRTEADRLTWIRDETFSVAIQPEDEEWVVSIHAPEFPNQPDVEGWVAYTGLKCPGYFPHHLVAPATAVADYIHQLLRRIT